ncbi:MAG: flagella basal body P-ring formation protein FlgA, partial [Burkholderiaceae bacterium]
AIPAGQALRESQLRPRVWFASGDQVRLVARGSGFHAVATGQALTAGIEGQPARARTDSGRVVVGAAVAHKEIDLTQ